MITLYLACLVFGGILLGFSIIFGGDSGHSGEIHHDIDFKGDADVTAGSSIGHDFDGTHNFDHGNSSSHFQTIESDHAASGESVDGVKILSFRNIIFFLTFFGLTGICLGWLDIAETATFPSAIGMGTFSWYFGYKLMKYLKKSESGEALDTFSLKGKIGKVTMEVGKNKKGKILVEAKGTMIQMNAVLAENQDLEMLGKHEEVLIIDIKDNTLICIKSDL